MFEVPMSQLSAYLSSIFGKVTEDQLRAKYDLRSHVQGFEFTIFEAPGKDGVSEFSMSDLGALASMGDEQMQDRSLIQFLEHLTSQEVVYKLVGHFCFVWLLLFPT